MFQRLFTFALLPLYAAVLSPGDYGHLSVILAVATLVSVAFTMGVDTAIVRNWFLLETRTDERAVWLGSVGLLTILGPASGAILIAGVLLITGGPILGTPVSWMILGIAGAATGVTALTLPLALLRAQERLGAFVRLNAAFAIANTVATVLLVVVLRLGVPGWLFGTLAAYLVTLVVAVRILPWPRVNRRTFSLAPIADALKFGIPLLPHLVSHWVLQLADRAVLVGLVSASALGEYTLASNLALVVLVAAAGFGQSSMPSFARVASADKAYSELRPLVSQVVAVICALGLAAGLLLPGAIRLLLPAAYAPAAHLIVWLVVGFTCAGLYQIPMNAISLLTGRTRWVWVMSGSAGALNIALLYIFVPSGGVLAAAQATAVAYGVLLLLTGLYAVRLAGRDWLPAARAATAVGVLAFGLAAGTFAFADGPFGDLIGRPLIALIGCAGLLGATRIRLPLRSYNVGRV